MNNMNSSAHQTLGTTPKKTAARTFVIVIGVALLSIYPLIKTCNYYQLIGEEKNAEQREADAIQSAAYLLQMGNTQDAIALYRSELKTHPKMAYLMNNFAWLLLTCSDLTNRNIPEAVTLAEKACQLTQYTNQVVMGTLGAAYAEAGRFDDAVLMANKACAASTSNNVFYLHRNQCLIRMYRQHQKRSDLNLLFLGDSITANWSEQGSNVWNEYFQPRRAANFGVGGDCTPNLLAQVAIDGLDGLNPKVVVLLIGTNDSDRSDAETIVQNIKAIISVIQADCVGSKVLLLGILPRNPMLDKLDNEVQAEVIKQVNQTLAKLDDGKTIRFLDVGNKFIGPDGKVSADLMPDFLHLNEKGYRKLAEGMEPILTEMMR